MLNTITVCVCVLARLFSPIYGLRVTDIQYLCIYSVIYIFLISSLTQRFSSEIVGIWNRIYAVLDRSWLGIVSALQVSHLPPGTNELTWACSSHGDGSKQVQSHKWLWVLFLYHDYQCPMGPKQATCLSLKSEKEGTTWQRTWIWERGYFCNQPRKSAKTRDRK